jgi:hypothetical protein
MKKIISLALFLFICITMSAQENPNRLLIREKSGNVKGFLVERVDSMFFVSQDGKVSADVQYKNYNSGASGDTIWVSVTRTAGCQAFRITCLSKVMASRLTDDAILASYFENTKDQMYYQDFTNAQMTGFTTPFKDNTDYTILTMGYDQYGIACTGSRADFHTPAKPLVGNPQVTWKVTDVGTDHFTMEFTPNSDVDGYGICEFEAGTAEQQFEQWGPMFGFSNMGDMIKQFSGKAYTTTYSNTWTGLAPGKDYEVYIQAWDVNGTYAPMVIAPVSTNKIGGEGLAEMTITEGDFGGDATNGYWKHIIYTPNDQVALHRDMIITKDAYGKAEWGETGVLAYLKSDTNPYNPWDSYWNQYGVDDAQWTVDMATNYIAFSIAKNTKDEWGPLQKLEFQTPAVPAAKAYTPKVKALGTRIMHGVTPAQTRPFASFKSAGVKLMQK